jgi:hypothetical protein
MSPSTMAIALILTGTAAATATAATSDADMLRCAALAARDARLDCYDSLAQQLSNKTGVPTAGLSPGTPATKPIAAAPVPAPPAPAMLPAATQASPAAAAAADPKNFGLTAVQQHTADAGPQMITANISSLSSNQKGDTFVVLDNGQTWSVTENDGWLATGQAVKIKRAAMGSYLMLIPSNHSYHVRRLK